MGTVYEMEKDSDGIYKVKRQIEDDDHNNEDKPVKKKKTKMKVQQPLTGTVQLQQLRDPRLRKIYEFKEGLGLGIELVKMLRKLK